MSPNTLITLILVLLPVIALVLIALISRKTRMLFLVIALVYTTSGMVFLMVKHDYENQAVIRNIDVVDTHLRQTYPEERWVISTVEDTHNHQRNIKVVFLNEEDKSYTYSVVDDTISQVAWSQGGDDSNPRHLEPLKE
jgi:hypothetical protein